MGNGYGSMKIFATSAGKPLAQLVCRHLSISLSNARVSRFKDGEVDVQILENVRDHDVFIISPLHPPAENFFEAVWLADAARRSSPSRLTYVIPYMGYTRSDRKSASRMPIGIRTAFDILTVSRPDRMIILDIHAEQSLAIVDGNIGVDHLFGSQTLFPALESYLGSSDFVIASPDKGGTTRAGFYANHLSAGSNFVILSKERAGAGEVNTDSIKIIGEVKDKIVVFVDDIIDSGGTMIAGAKAVKAAGAKKVVACATHALFSGEAGKTLHASDIDRIFVTDSIWHDLQELRVKSKKVEVVSVSGLLAKAIRRTHDGESLSALIPE